MMDLYYMPISAPCRAVMLTAEAIGVPLNLKMIDLLTGDHLKPEYEQMNPQKTIPLLVDDDYKLTESRAIMGYLVDKYGKNGRLHPKDINTRALVNQRLHFDIGTLYKALSAYYYPVMFNGAREYDPDNYERLKSAFEILDKLLEGQDYSVGRSLTIADLSLAVSVSTAEAFGFEVRKYKNVTRWYEKVKNSAPGFRKINDEGIDSLKKVIADVKNK